MTLRTAEQLRAARAILKLKQSELAEISGVSTASIRRLEREEGLLGMQVATLEKLQEAFESRGVRFIGDKEASLEGGPGVRLTKG